MLTTHHSRAMSCLLLAATLVPLGCSTGQIANEALSAGSMFGRQIGEQRSFFGRSTAIFYPNGVPEQMATLPSLSEDQKAEIQKDLDLQAKLLLDAYNSSVVVIQKSLGRTSIPIADQKFGLLVGGNPVAGINDQGIILIDVRVIQGIYRGVLMTTLDEPTSFDAASNERQKRALRELISARQTFLSANPIPSVTLAKSMIKATGSEGDLLDKGMSLLGDDLSLTSQIMLSEQASKSHDDALAFLVAHEIGHRALNHYARRAAGEKQMDLELEADQFGALLVTLARNSSVKPNYGYPIEPKNVARYRMGYGPWCVDNINYEPHGHETFFKFGYTFAGFDSMGQISSSSYPSKETRDDAADLITVQTFYAIKTAQDFSGSCMYNASERASIAANPLQAIANQRGSYKEMLEDAERNIAKSGSQVDPEYIRRQRLYSQLLSTPMVFDSVFFSFFSRLK